MKRQISLFLAIAILITSCCTVTDSFAYFTDREIVSVSTQAADVDFKTTLTVENELVSGSDIIPKVDFDYTNYSNSDIFSFLEIGMSWEGDSSLDNVVVYDGDLSDSEIQADTSYSLALPTTITDGKLFINASSVVEDSGYDSFKFVFKNYSDDVLNLSAVNDFKQNVYSEIGFNGSYLFDFSITIANPEIFTYTSDGSSITITGLTDYGKTFETIVIPSDMDGIPVTQISDAAFVGSIFTSVSVPASVTSIGTDAFTNCQMLTGIDVAEENTVYKDSDGVVFSEDGTTLVAYPAGKPVTAYSVPEGVVTILDAFNNSNKLEVVNIPSTVSTIHPTAFESTSQLAAIYVDNYEGSISDAPWASNATVYWLALPEDLEATDIFIYTIDDGTGEVTITGLTELGKTVRNLEIPETIEGYTVTIIEEYALAETGATEITIPSTVDTIKAQTMDNTSNFMTVQTINYNAANVASLGVFSSAFKGSNVTTLNIGETVTTLNNSMFYGMNNLITVNYNGSITGTVADYTFRDCTSLAYFNIGDNVTVIPAGLMKEVNTVKEVIIPEGITSIGDYAFYKTGMESITIPASVTSIGTGVFNGNTALKTVSFENNVIGNYMFFGCKGLESVVIPETITSIGEYAFNNCTSLTNITFENSVIGAYMFQGCTGLTEVHIPASITIIYDSAFRDCTNLSSVTLETTVIGSNTFRNCSSLTSIDLTGITSIGNSAFEKAGLTEVTVPSSVTKVGSYAFHNNSNLTSITIENSVLGAYMFSNCKNLQSIVIPASVTTVGDSAFYACTSLSEIVIENAVLGAYMFQGCTSLTSIEIPDSITAIPASAFRDCSNLVEVILPETLVSIGNNAFTRDTGLTEIYIPASVTYIDSYAFQYCTNILTIYYAGSASGFPWGATNATLYDGSSVATLEEPVEEEIPIEETTQEETLADGETPEGDTTLEEPTTEGVTVPEETVTEDQMTTEEIIEESPVESGSEESVEGEEITSPAPDAEESVNDSNTASDQEQESVIEETVQEETPSEDVPADNIYEIEDDTVVNENITETKTEEDTTLEDVEIENTITETEEVETETVEETEEVVTEVPTETTDETTADEGVDAEISEEPVVEEPSTEEI